jgi:hypothetical protein
VLNKEKLQWKLPTTECVNSLNGSLLSTHICDSRSVNKHSTHENFTGFIIVVVVVVVVVLLILCNLY